MLGIAAWFGGDRYLYLSGVLLFPVLAGQMCGEWRRDRMTVLACLSIVVASWAIYPQLAHELASGAVGTWLGWVMR